MSEDCTYCNGVGRIYPPWPESSERCHVCHGTGGKFVIHSKETEKGDDNGQEKS